jgi:hypothetical protein
MFAVVHALCVQQFYLEGTDFTMYTDRVSKSNTYFIDATKPVTSASTLVKISAALWGFYVEVSQRSKNRGKRIEPKGCYGECLAFCCAA